MSTRGSQWARCVCAAAAAGIIAGCDTAGDAFSRLRGDSHKLDKEYVEAIAWYSRIPSNRQDVAVLRSMAAAYRELGDVTNAVALSCRVYKCTRDIADLERVLEMQSGHEAYAGVVAALKESGTTDPEEWLDLMDTVQHSGLSNRMAEMVGEVTAALPQSSTNSMCAGALWMQVDNHTNAAAAYAQALAREGGRHEWRMALVAALARAKQHDAALSNLCLLERALPGNPAVLQLKGGVLAETGRRDAAIAQYRALLRLSGGDAMAMNNLAYLLLKREDGVSEGYELALSAVQLERSYCNLDTLGYACYKRGAYGAALRYLAEAGELMRDDDEPVAPEIEFHTGLVHARRGDVDKAVPFLRRAFKGDPALRKELAREQCYEGVKDALDAEPGAEPGAARPAATRDTVASPPAAMPGATTNVHMPPVTNAADCAHTTL